MTKARIPILAAAVLGLMAWSACLDERSRETRTKLETIGLEGVDSAEIRLRLRAGDLRLRSAAIDRLMEGRFAYSRERWAPRIDFQASDGRGRLFIEQGRTGPSLGRNRNAWELDLTDRVPLDLDIDLGAGQARIDTSGLKLRRLEIDMGVGRLELDLAGPRDEGFEVAIDGGIGEAIVVCPEEIGVLVTVDGGLGSVHASGFEKRPVGYVNRAYGRTGKLIEVRIDAGIGSVRLRTRPARTASF